MKIQERAVERSAPYLAGVTTVAVWYWALCAPFPSPAVGLLSASGTAAAVLVGFLATAKAVVLGLANTEAFSKLKSANFTLPLFEYLFSAVWGGIIFLVFSMIGFFLGGPNSPVPPWYPPLFVWLGATEVFLYIRITGLLFMLLKRI